MITTRRSEKGDAFTIARIGAETFSNSFIVPGDTSGRNQLIDAYVREHFIESAIQQEMHQEGTFFHVVCYNYAPIGFAKVNKIQCPHPVSRPVSPVEFQIQRLYMSLNATSQGHGQQLMDYLLAWLRQQRATGVWLGVYEENHRAMKFYERNGFTKVGLSQFKYTLESNEGSQEIVDIDYIYSRLL